MGNEIKDDVEMTMFLRRLTPTECGRLQGFDEHHMDCVEGDSAKYSMAGNSWAVQCANFIITGIHKADAEVTGKYHGLKYGTISSGVEAHTQASKGLGGKAVFFSEIAPAPYSLLRHHWPEVPVLGDMTRVDYDREKKVIHNAKYDGYQLMDAKTLGFNPVDAEYQEIPCEYGEVELVSGGTPCTDMSIAGKRKGAAEGSNTRSALSYQLPRIGEALGARWILWENVPGALSSNGGRDLAWFLYRCMEAGYTMAWRVLDAQYVRTAQHPRGVPQRRRRIWAVGYKGDDWRIPCKAVFEPISALGHTEPVRTSGKGFIKAPGDGIVDIDAGKSDLELFTEFISLADKRIVDYLVKKGISESPEKTISDLKKASVGQSIASDDFFSDLFGSVETVHQGRGLTEKDIVIDFPDEGDITKVSNERLFRWAKSVSTSVMYLGSLFKPNTCVDNATVDDIAEKLLSNLGNAGVLSKGRIVTMKVPEWNAGVTKEDLAKVAPDVAEIYDGDVCGLSDILDWDAPVKYLLSWRACWGILKRASARGKMLPLEMAYALVCRIIDQAQYVKWAVMNASDKAKDGKLSEKDIAKTCFDDYVSLRLSFDSVEEKNPKTEGLDEQMEDEESSENDIDAVFGISEDEENV